MLGHVFDAPLARLLGGGYICKVLIHLFLFYWESRLIALLNYILRIQKVLLYNFYKKTLKKGDYDAIGDQIFHCSLLKY